MLKSVVELGEALVVWSSAVIDTVVSGAILEVASVEATALVATVDVEVVDVVVVISRGSATEVTSMAAANPMPLVS